VKGGGVVAQISMSMNRSLISPSGTSSSNSIIFPLLQKTKQVIPNDELDFILQTKPKKASIRVFYLLPKIQKPSLTELCIVA
jgi:hypothetical protein